MGIVPRNCISIEEAKNLQDNWVSTRQIIIDEAIGGMDTREFFFSIQELEDYINYVKANSQDEDPGIRIYFGANNTPANNHATVFLAPTKGAENNHDNNYDILPLNKGLGRIPPKGFDPNAATNSLAIGD